MNQLTDDTHRDLSVVLKALSAFWVVVFIGVIAYFLE